MDNYWIIFSIIFSHFQSIVLRLFVSYLYLYIYYSKATSLKSSRAYILHESKSMRGLNFFLRDRHTKVVIVVDSAIVTSSVISQLIWQSFFLYAVQWVLDYRDDLVQKKFTNNWNHDNWGIPLNDIGILLNEFNFLDYRSSSSISWNSR